MDYLLQLRDDRPRALDASVGGFSVVAARRRTKLLRTAVDRARLDVAGLAMLAALVPSTELSYFLLALLGTVMLDSEDPSDEHLYQAVIALVVRPLPDQRDRNDC